MNTKTRLNNFNDSISKFYLTTEPCYNRDDCVTGKVRFFNS